ncbi:MAG: Gldg family protein [Opitutaceae bacterium]
MRQPPQPSQSVVSEWEQSFQIVPVAPTATELPADLAALVVAHPQNLPPRLQFAIDQFLLGGKPVFLAVDPASQHFKRQGGPQGMMMGGPQPNGSSDLPALLSAYGIAYEPQKVVGDLQHPLSVGGPNNTVMRMPTWLALESSSFNAQSLASAQLKSMWFIEAGALSLKAGSPLTFTPLVETSADSGTVESAMLQFADGDAIARQLVPSGKKTVAALVTGKFTTAFPDGAPKEEPKPDGGSPALSPTAPAAEGEALKESKTTSTLFVVADTDWLLDEFSLRRMNFFGQVAMSPYSDNLSFAANAVEFLGGSQDLISIRGKGSSLRPFIVTRRMEVEAQKQYQEKLTALEARLSEVQQKLSEIQGQKADGNRLVATPEMTKAVEDFQKQQAALRGERREIRRALREDIDALENRLLAINLLATPLLIGAFGIWFYRTRKN